MLRISHSIPTLGYVLFSKKEAIQKKNLFGVSVSRIIGAFVLSLGQCLPNIPGDRRGGFGQFCDVGTVRGDGTRYRNQHIALGAFEHGLQIACLRSLPSVAWGKNRSGELGRVDARIVDPLPDGGADDKADGTHSIIALIEFLSSAGDAVRHCFALVFACLTNRRLQLAPSWLDVNDAMNTPLPLLSASLMTPPNDRAP